MKEIVLFDTYNTSFACLNAKEELMAEYPKHNPTTEEIWDKATQDEQENWDILEDHMYSLCAPFYSLLAVGSCGTWRGSFAGGFVASSFKELIAKLGKDCGYYKIFCEVKGKHCGPLTIKCSHHDSTNVARVKGITEKGMYAFEDWEAGRGFNNLSEKEMHEKMFKSSVWTRNIKAEEK